MKYLAIFVVTVVLTLVGRSYIAAWLSPPTVQNKLEPVDVVPRWIAASKCVEMNADEQAREALALKVLRDFPPIAVMPIAAMRHLGLDQYRRVGNRYERLCPLEDLDPEIATLTLAHGTFLRSYLHSDELRLARRVGARDPKIVEAVARTAFNSHPIQNEYGVPGDIRSIARVTLAEMGAAAAPWSEQAFQAINTETALGTTAAQAALASGHPLAAQKTVELLDEILKKNPTDPIRRSERDRFYDLAYGLASLGPEARPHAGPIWKMMGRQVQSLAPPFGMVPLRPRKMCRVVELIGGPEAESILTQEVCRPKVDVYEQ